MEVVVAELEPAQGAVVFDCGEFGPMALAAVAAANCLGYMSAAQTQCWAAPGAERRDVKGIQEGLPRLADN